MTEDDTPLPVVDLWIVAALCAGVLLATIIFVPLYNLDLLFANQFYDREAATFPLARHPVALFFNELIEWIALALALFALGGLIWTSIAKRAWAGLTTRAYTFLTLSVLIGPGLIANALFKENWGRARPRQVMEFGGTLDFSPAFIMSDQCPGNCSFVSGDASMGFALLALALVMPPLLGLERRIWAGLAVLFGCFIGGVRIVQGAHFLSDVIFAGLFVSLVIFLLKLIVLDRHWGVSALAEKKLTRFGVWASPRLGIVHDEETHSWREAVFARLHTGGWKRALWLFFLSGPKDFGLPEPQKEEGRPHLEVDGSRPSKDGS